MTYLILRDARLYELKTEFARIRATSEIEIKFFLKQFLERHNIQVINLLKEIEVENPEIYLNLKTKMRGLGLYNEEFSIQSMIYREEERQGKDLSEKKVLTKYRQLEKSELCKVFEGSSAVDAAEDIVSRWTNLFVDHEPL